MDLGYYKKKGISGLFSLPDCGVEAIVTPRSTSRWVGSNTIRENVQKELKLIIQFND